MRKLKVEEWPGIERQQLPGQFSQTLTLFQNNNNKVEE
jgi:hypothetical protein